jgi:hypothetical protein
VEFEVSDTFARGLNGLDGLEMGEQVQFLSILSSISRTLESFYFQNKEGGLDSRLFSGWFLQYLDLHANPGVKQFWAIRKHQYSTEFVAFLEKRIAGSDSKPLYRE